MNAIKHLWQVWLRPNYLTKTVDNDFIAQVSTSNTTRKNEDIARRLTELRSEYSYDTILNVLNQSDRIIREFLQQGMSVQVGNCRFTPRITGTWLGSSAEFNPAHNKITVDIIPSADLKQALSEVGVKVLDVKSSNAFIGLVTDTTNDAVDGSITPNEDILIEGDKIRIIPEMEPAVGIYFVSSTGTETKVTRKLTINDPKRIIARVPALTPGQYTLKIVTRFSNSSVMLNDPRTILYDVPLVVR